MQNYLATQATATVTLLGVVAYLVHELSKSGTLNRHDFEKHLEDLGAPESDNESPEEQRMRPIIEHLKPGAFPFHQSVGN